METRNPTRPQPQVRPQVRPQLTVLDRVLVGTVTFQGVTGLAGGLLLMTAPGEEEFLPDEYLGRIPFGSWFWPGVILAGGLGIGLMAWIVVELLLPEWSWLQPLYLAVGAVIVATAVAPAVRGRLRHPRRRS